MQSDAFGSAVSSRNEACAQSGPKGLCVALKYVGYQNPSGAVTITENEAEANVAAASKLWSQCGIRFWLRKFEIVEPKAHNVPEQTANYSDLDVIRGTFDDDSSLLVVTTFAWNRTGSLGKTGANAWTEMPGNAPYGAILEQPVGRNSNLVAHELGHYLGLLHVNEEQNLMNAIIYGTSTRLSADQCKEARSSLVNFWHKALK